MDSPPLIQTITIVGVGLIGGSFALALRDRGFTGTILGVSSPATVDEALRLGVIDRGCPLEEGVQQGDLIYLANPIGRIINQLPAIAAAVRPSSLVTDAGSTKQVIMEHASRLFEPGVFLGGHPMAGKESRGVAAADAGLFVGRPYIITPAEPQHLDRPIAREFLNWILLIGGLQIILSPLTHDERVGRASHLPQMCSTALSAMLGRGGSSPFLAEVAGPGLFDMTRLALSSHDVWRDIITTNNTVLSTALGEYIVMLQELKASVETGATERLFTEAAKFSRQVRKID